MSRKSKTNEEVTKEFTQKHNCHGRMGFGTGYLHRPGDYAAMCTKVCVLRDACKATTDRETILNIRLCRSTPPPSMDEYMARYRMNMTKGSEARNEESQDHSS